MPELPEVETVRRGINKYVKGQQINAVEIHQPQLRWPIPPLIKRLLPGHSIIEIKRRGKYLLLNCGVGTIIIHLGMSGSLRIQNSEATLQKHDHVVFRLSNQTSLCFNDPRRFGCLLWEEHDPLQHRLLSKLGPEPLSKAFDVDYLFAKSRKRQVAIKQFIMNSQVVVGVGNIYACEALFNAGIHPECAAAKLSKPRYQRLVDAIKRILAQAIKQGGTTLRDFITVEGKPGYFKQQLHVYGRGGEACTNCKATLKSIRLAQRSTVYCSHCQT